jgi:hypothetical protein
LAKIERLDASGWKTPNLFVSTKDMDKDFGTGRKEHNRE